MNVLKKKIPLRLQDYFFSPQIHYLLILNWEMSNQLAPPAAHQAGCRCLNDWIHARCPSLEG